MKTLTLFALLLCSASAYAWPVDCTVLKNQQSTNPKGQCYVAPKPTPAPAGSPQQGQGQLQGEQQGQGQGQGQVAAADSAAKAKSSSESGLVLDQSSQGSGNFTYREAANVVNLPSVFVSGCGTGFGAGASAVKGSALIEYTGISKPCWRMLSAYGALSAGYRQIACLMYVEIYNSNLQGSASPLSMDCAPPPPLMIERPAPPAAAVPPPGYVTHEELNALVKRGLIK